MYTKIEFLLLYIQSLSLQILYGVMECVASYTLANVATPVQPKHEPSI